MIKTENRESTKENASVKVNKTIRLIRYAADCMGFEVFGRIWLRDKQTGEEYK